MKDALILRRSMLTASVTLGSIAISAVVGLSIGSGAITLDIALSALLVAASLILPWYFPSLSLVILGFAGRFDIPPFAASFFDVAFWTTLGLAIAAFAARRTLPMRLIHPVSITLCMFTTWVAVTLLPMSDKPYSQDKAFRVLFYSMAFFLFTQMFLSSREKIVELFVSFIMFVDVWSSISLAVTIQSKGFTGINRVVPLGGGPITLARLVGFAILACIGLSYFHRKRRLFLVNAAALTGILFITGSRGPSLFLILAAFSFPIFASLNRQSRRRSSVVMFAVLSAIVSIFPLMRYAASLGIPFATRFFLLFQDDKGISVDSREDSIALGWRIAKESHFIGSGVGSWPILTGKGDIVDYPHNIVIEILVEQGAVGVGLFALFVVFTVMTAISVLRHSSNIVDGALTTTALTSFLYALMIAQTSGDLYDNRYLWFFAGLVVSCSNLQGHSRDPLSHQQRNLSIRRNHSERYA